MLEQQMHDFKELPARVERLESQILQLRDETRSEFSAVRKEVQQVRDELREDIRIGVEESQNLARLLHSEAMDAVTTLRRDAVERLDRLIELQQRSASHES